MSAIYLRHARHGTKVACSDAEAVADEANGWERYQVAALLQPMAAASVPVAPVITILETPTDDRTELEYWREQYRLRKGESPHWLKKVESLKRDLGEFMEA
jgi:hypothetical protein